MKNCLIIEDEELAARRLRRLLSEVAPQYQVTHEVQTVTHAVSMLGAHSFDLIFLDIHLADGLSFEIFEEIEVKTPIVFTTAYDAYALEAFKQHSIDYLLKPIQKAPLRRALSKYEELHSSPFGDSKVLEQLISSLKQSENTYKTRFLVQMGDKMRTVPSAEIQYFYAEDKTVFLITKAGKRYYVNHTLRALEDLLNPAEFYRVNRKIIVNINSIVEVLHYSKSKFKIILNHPLHFDVFVPAEKITVFKEWLSND